ncbi:toll/interleukin-1 receptor domain-containing protein [Microbulbifer sp. Q7]|uniref:toll/interleukin-1 receptor domain-containing protein n=1 Tax=Microbulbifer sp. Q7 TaxID=1785091 RepID=UPI000837159F|nr:toll/interleukin-1 receptor domain-containing protein [Microbulbifer sp. Q7]
MSNNNNSQRYRAFISYSHTNEQAAKWLQRALESYRLPKHLVGRQTAAGVLEPRIGKVFRDRTDLSLAPDLTEELRDRLAASDYLIVICSPDAAKSRWVNEEIQQFIRMRAPNRVLALIADGEPFASFAGHPERECLPPALRFQQNPDGSLSERAAEPLASDMRAKGDGPRMALLKILASILDLGLDELVRRDHQRRMRVQQLISATALVAVTIFAGLSYLAISARNVAEERRLAAEDLVNFMLTDLRQRLEPIGRLDALDLVGEKVLDFYSQQKTTVLNADALGRQASAMHLLGEIRDLAGDTDAAIALFSHAAQTTEELLAREPDNAQRVFDHAQSTFWVGYPDYQRGEYQRAQYWFDQYLRLSRRLVELEPEKSRSQTELFYALNTQAVLKYADQQYAESLALFEEAGGILQALPANAENREALINNTAWIASVHFMRGDFDAAIAARLHQLSLIEQWRKEEPDRSNLTDYTMTAEHELIRLFQVNGDRARLEETIHSGLQTAEKLIRQDPQNLDYRLRAYQFYLTAALSGYGKSAGPESLLIDIRKLAAELPENLDAQISRWTAELGLHLKMSEPKGSLELLSAAQAFGRWASEMSAPGQQKKIQHLAMLADLVLALDPALAEPERQQHVRSSKNILGASTNQLKYAVHCNESHLDPLLSTDLTDTDPLMSVVRRCFGLQYTR